MSVYEKFGARMISEDKFLPAGRAGPAPLRAGASAAACAHAIC